MQLFKVIYHGTGHHLKNNLEMSKYRYIEISKKLCIKIFNNTCKKR